MKPETKKKIETIENLLRQIDDIYDQIAFEIEGSSIAETSKPEVEQPQEKRHYKKREEKPEPKGLGTGHGVRHCKLCGKEGHRSDHCPNKDREDTDDLKDPVESKDDEVPEGALTRMQFSQVRECKHKEMSANEAAEACEVDEEEARYAYMALTYPGYLKLR